jgi:hypothetical protein
MKHCENCGAAVSDAYARVNGDRNGRVQSCPDCNADHRDGRAVQGTLYTLRVH